MSLLGGLLGLFGANKQAKAQKQAEIDRYPILRHSAETAGFNPLTALLAGGGTQSISLGSPPLASYAAIADGLTDLADELTGKTRRDAITSSVNKALAEVKLDQLNAGEAGKIVEDTKRVSVRVPALTNRRQQTPKMPRDPEAKGMRPLPEVSGLDPRRQVENQPLTSSGGFMQIDNPYLPFPLSVPTADGDEPLQWYDWPSMVPVALGSLGAYFGRKTGEALDKSKGSGPIMSIGGKKYQLEKSKRKPKKTMGDLAVPSDFY